MIDHPFYREIEKNKEDHKQVSWDSPTGFGLRLFQWAFIQN